MRDKVETNRKRREKLESLGLCVVCGKDKRTKTSKRCEECSKKAVNVAKNWINNNKEDAKRVRREQVKKQRQNLRRKVLEMLGCKCSCCGEDHHCFLQVDHINKDGGKHRREKNGTASIYRDILKNPGKYDVRLLCANCHNAISYYGCCPHSKGN